MWCHRVLACALVIGVLTGRAGAHTPVVFGFPDHESRVAVRLAVEGAATGLARLGCQDLFAAVTDTALGLAGMAQTASADQPDPLTIVLWVRDTAQVPEEVLTHAQMEVTGIFRQAGVQTVWRVPSSSSANTAGSREPRLTIAIVSYDQAERLHPALTRGGVEVGFALNSSSTTRANVAYVFYHRVKHLTGANGVHLAPVLGAAMAHEIGHLLLDNAHSQTGVMRADWTKADLQLVQNSQLFFTAEQAELIRIRVAALRQH
jgi:hypothetical protein